jgi:carboxyl-terminal processing protease
MTNPQAPGNGQSWNTPAQNWNVNPANYGYPSNPSNSWTPAPEVSHQVKVSARYQDPRMLGFLNQTSFNQIASLFTETSRLIDARHVNPPSYEVRTAAALNGLADAVANPDFLAANRVNPSSSAISGLQQELSQLAQTQPARSSTEALGLMQWAAEISQQRIGVRREAAAVEFLNSMIDSLDKYSALIPAKSQSGPSAGLEEQIVGIGVELKTHAQGVLVTDLIAGGPAAGAGLRKGDIITSVNNQQLGGMSLNQAAEYIGGPMGTTVRVTIDRQGQRINATMQRRSVYVSSVVDAKFLDSQRKVGYLRVKQFSESTAEDLLKEMWTLYNAGMDSLVLDLRGNPGGLLSESVDVSDLFLPSGRIVATKGRTQADDSDFQAKRADTWKIPLVVLVDGNSASASEIFAAAIQENQRGLIVGSHSYGKGTVQTHFPLQSIAGELKLTTAKFYSPTGREMAGHGVTPDVVVPKSPGAMEIDETRDPVLFAALEVVNSGQPAQLADQAGQANRQIGAIFGR